MAQSPGNSNRQSRRQSARGSRSGSNTPIEFPGFMGLLQRNMKWLFIVGIAVLILSIGAPILTSIIGDSDEVNQEEDTEQVAAPPAVTVTSAAENRIIRTYSVEPECALKDGVEYEAVIYLEDDRSVRISLLQDKSPGYVNNFIFLAQNNFYDGLTFHRVIEGFVAQGGDPTGTGRSGPGYVLTEEFNDIYLDREGLLSMAKSPAGVSGSQFFITLGPTPWLTGDFTVFGQVTEGMDVARSIQQREPGPGQPDAETILRIEIIEK